MTQNPFVTKKSVHINLTKESHAALREKMFRHDLTMQDIFQEFAHAILELNPKADYFITKACNRKLREQIEGKLKPRGIPSPIGEYDAESLYNLIEEENEKKINVDK